eukprot:scaffold860_cov155-Ochromonas_danica.AAC.1
MQAFYAFFLCIVLLTISDGILGFMPMPRHVAVSSSLRPSTNNAIITSSSRAALQMNFFSDAFRFFTNLNKEASARHILMTGPDAEQKLNVLKEELQSPDITDLQAAFAELASKV